MDCELTPREIEQQIINNITQNYDFRIRPRGTVITGSGKTVITIQIFQIMNPIVAQRHCMHSL